MKITFKDVGQGDSILLEWEADGVPKIGVIDCSKKGKTNPVLEYIKSADYDEIEFAILSHPHTDHYSGFFELLDYCHLNKKTVKRFYHTADAREGKYWRYFEVDTDDSEQLRKLFKKAWEMHKEKLLRISYLNEGHPIYLGGNITLECLAPSHDELVKYKEILKFDPVTNVKKLSQAANYLSTVFKLSIADDYVLLTSDAEKEAFLTLLKWPETFKNKRLLLCQMPHHGSIKNHEETFWKELTGKPSNPAVASAGEHRSYHHPSYETLLAFHNNGHRVYSTTYLNGMRKYVKEMRSIGFKLDAISEIADEYSRSGDRVFEWSELIKD